MPRTVAASVALLIFGALTACGNDAPAKSSPSIAEFCEVFQDQVVDLDDDASLTEVKDAYSRLENVGLPTDVPEKAREGRQVMLDYVRDANSAADLEVDDLGRDVMSRVRAFNNYVATTCGLDD